MLVRTKNVSNEQKNLWPNKKILGKKFKIFVKIFEEKKSSAEDFYVRRNIDEYSEK